MQASVSGLGTGQLKLQLSTSPGFPPGCQYQVNPNSLYPLQITIRIQSHLIQTLIEYHNDMIFIPVLFSTLMPPPLNTLYLSPGRSPCPRSAQAPLL